MARRPRRNHGAQFTARVPLAAIRGEKSLADLAEQFDVFPHQITEWKEQLLERAEEVFGGAARSEAPPAEVTAMQRKNR